MDEPARKAIHTVHAAARPHLKDPYYEADVHAARLADTAERAGGSWRAVIAFAGQAPIGFAHGCLLHQADPYTVPGGTFRIFDLAAVPDWEDGQRHIHDALFNHQRAARAVLHVDHADHDFRELAEAWGYEKKNRSQPYGGAPVFTVMTREKG
ncbi:hypothetical protein [Streptomyces sp. NPDC051561]|uniref:hypothetical protein n=1 Tax=Streptomyces sp. NPDC051561 TaxID=3365658 RepID=UPI0037B54DE4